MYNFGAMFTSQSFHSCFNKVNLKFYICQAKLALNHIHIGILQSYISQALFILKRRCSAKPFRPIKNGLVYGRLACTSNTPQMFWDIRQFKIAFSPQRLKRWNKKHDLDHQFNHPIHKYMCQSIMVSVHSTLDV